MEKVKENFTDTAVRNRPSEALVITRVFDATPEKVWKAFTDETEVKKWWGPRDFTAPVSKIDLRVGGRNLSCMRGPDGKEFWSTGTYKEIVPNKKLVVTDSFADDKGNIIPASELGMPGEWPLELMVTITLEAENGKTSMTLRHEGLPAEMKEPCRDGWNESFDKMDKIL